MTDERDTSTEEITAAEAAALASAGEAIAAGDANAAPAAAPDSTPSRAFIRVQLPAFEGPLDLLLHLIQQNEIEITDIPIAKITKQYLEMLDLMRELDLEVAGEFLVMAATLMRIKSRMLL